MEVLKVVIQSLEEAKEGNPVIKGTTPENTEMTKDLTVAILEGGMQSGKTSLMFMLKMDDGTFKGAECSAANFEALASALKGAEERFKK